MHLVCFQGRLCFSCLVSSSSASSHSPSLVLLQRTLIKHKCMSLTSRHFLDSFRYSVKIWNRLFLLLLLFSKKKLFCNHSPFHHLYPPVHFHGFKSLAILTACPYQKILEKVKKYNAFTNLANITSKHPYCQNPKGIPVPLKSKADSSTSYISYTYRWH